MRERGVCKQTENMYQSVLQILSSGSLESFVTPWKEPQEAGTGRGTGFVVEVVENEQTKCTCLVATCFHVIQASFQAQILTPTSMRAENNSSAIPPIVPAQIVAVWPDYDVALLKVSWPHRMGFQALTLQTTLREIKLNTIVTAVGYGLGLEGMSTNEGKVSRLWQTGLGMQHDATINPGNSGGPLLQKKKVIGMNFQAISNGNAMYYAVPAFKIKLCMEQYNNNNQEHDSSLPKILFAPRTGVLYGVQLEAATPRGVRVWSMLEKSPFKSELQIDDVLESVTCTSCLASGTMGDPEATYSIRPNGDVACPELGQDAVVNLAEIIQGCKANTGVTFTYTRRSNTNIDQPTATATATMTNNRILEGGHTTVYRPWERMPEHIVFFGICVVVLRRNLFAQLSTSATTCDILSRLQALYTFGDDKPPPAFGDVLVVTHIFSPVETMRNIPSIVKVGDVVRKVGTVDLFDAPRPTNPMTAFKTHCTRVYDGTSTELDISFGVRGTHVLRLPHGVANAAEDEYRLRVPGYANCNKEVE